MTMMNMRGDGLGFPDMGGAFKTAAKWSFFYGVLKLGVLALAVVLAYLAFTHSTVRT